MTDAAIEDLVARITGGETPRVWSLLVTVFGELAQDSGAAIGGALLSRLTDVIGIRPEATRVALHRLRKDGWIDSRRNGRSSDHVLTDWGRRQSAAATPRIYSADPGAEAAWLVLPDPGAQAGAPELSVWVAPNVGIAAAPGGADAFSTALDGKALPGWMAAKVCPPETVAQSLSLAGRLADVAGALAEPARLTPLQIAVLRVLIVHSWRRIVLRAPALPDHVFPPDWRGAECRALVADLLDRLPRQTLAGLSREVAA